MHTSKPNGAGKEPASAPLLPSAPEKTVRRTRGSASRLRSESQAARVSGFVPAFAGRLTNPDSNTKASSHANGSANHAAAADVGARATSRINGPGHAFSSDSAEAMNSPLSLDAGSDDASGASVAIAAPNGAAGADRDACAALAERSNLKERHSSLALKGGEEQLRVPSEVSGETDTSRTKEPHPSGEGPLPEVPAEFVEEVHSRIDLFEIWQELLESDDEKIKQRAVEKLTEMRYKGAQSLAEEPQRVVWELAPARRDP